VRLPSKEEMKRTTIVGTVGGGLGCLGVLAAAQGVLHTGSPQSPPTSWPPRTQTNAFAAPFAGTNWLFKALPPGYSPELNILTLPPSARPDAASAPPNIPAGIYRTFPYSCIVVVPGPHPDDKCVFPPPGGDSAMPIIRPELQFIPWTPPHDR
jgi:hypothetical protein